MSEKKKKVFISGPMTGVKDLNKPAFDKAEQWLTHAGYSVFNPARMHFDEAWTHEEIMRIDLAALAQCDYILMLAGFEASIGAMQEYRYAMATGIELFHMSDIVNKKEQKSCTRIEIESFLVDYIRTELGTNIKDDSVKKTCGTCKHNKGCEPLRTCSDCGPFKNWEPKEEE